MSQKNNGQIVRYQQGKTKFEILTKKGAVLKYRQKKLGLQYVLMIDTIYTKVSQGKIAKSSELKRVFGTTDFNECVNKILENGDLNLSSSERKDKSNSKLNEVVYYITKNYINPLSNIPHPRDRILNCMKECGIKINTTKSTKTQALNAIKKMRGKLFFTKAHMLTVNLTIKYKYDINKIGQMINKITSGASYQQKWNDKGCVFVLEMSKGDLEDLGNKLNKVTNGGDYDLKFNDVIDYKVAGNNGYSNNKNKSKRHSRNQYLMDQKDLKKLNRKKKKKKTITNIKTLYNI
eukprot:270745_1